MFKLLKIASVVALTIADPNAAASSDELRAATGGVEGAAAHAGTAPLRGAFDHLPPHMRQDFDPVEVEKILGRTPEPHELERFRREQTMMRMDPRYRMMQDMKMRLETMDKNDPEYARQSMFVEREEQRMNEMQRMRFGGPRDMGAAGLNRGAPSDPRMAGGMGGPSGSMADSERTYREDMDRRYREDMARRRGDFAAGGMGGPMGSMGGPMGGMGGPMGMGDSAAATGGSRPERDMMMMDPHYRMVQDMKKRLETMDKSDPEFERMTSMVEREEQRMGDMQRSRFGGMGGPMGGMGGPMGGMGGPMGGMGPERDMMMMDPHYRMVQDMKKRLETMDKSDPKYTMHAEMVEREERRMSEMHQARFAGAGRGPPGFGAARQAGPGMA